MTGAFMVDRLGRRTLFIISNVGMLFGKFSLGSMVVSPHRPLVDFALWTITTALFNELHNQSAAKGLLWSVNRVNMAKWYTH